MSPGTPLLRYSPALSGASNRQTSIFFGKEAASQLFPAPSRPMMQGRMRRLTAGLASLIFYLLCGLRDGLRESATLKAAVVDEHLVGPSGRVSEAGAKQHRATDAHLRRD